MSGSNRGSFLNLEEVRGSQKYEFEVAWAAAPHPAKAWKGGEDAIFVTPNVLVVADGVSAWSKVGIDAGIYARRLTAQIKGLVEGRLELYYIEHPDELALKAVQLVEEKGSSTLSILTLHPRSGVMRSFHVGDSLFGIFKRNGQHVMAVEQQSSFDTPFQVYGGSLNSLPISPLANFEPSDIFKGLYSEFSFGEVANSAVVLASDGLWDNIHVAEISETIGLEEVDLRRKTGLLMERVMHYCQLPSYASPYFSKGCAKGLAMEQRGKLDDVSIVVASIICFEE